MKPERACLTAVEYVWYEKISSCLLTGSEMVRNNQVFVETGPKGKCTVSTA